MSVESITILKPLKWPEIIILYLLYNLINTFKLRSQRFQLMSGHIKLKAKSMQRIDVASRSILLTFYGIMVVTISKGQAKNIDEYERDYINWVKYLYRNHDYCKHTEPRHIYKYGCKWGTWVTFPNKIEAIESKVGSWKTPEELFCSQDFIAMYKHPGYYWKYVLDYLSDPNYTAKQKKIAIYGLENLTYDLYLPFVQSCYKFYKQQRLSEALLQMVLSFEFLRIHPLVTAVRYKHEKAVVESFLREIKSHIGATSSIGLQIEKILSGRLAEEWTQNRASDYIDCQNRLPCSETICDAYI